MSKSETLREEFLQALLEKAEFQGWSEQVIEQVCVDIGLDKKHYHLWFSDGAREILDLLESRYDQEMLEIIAEQEEKKGITDKIAFALKTRICDTSRSQMLSIKNSQFYVNPANAPGALKSAWRTVDLIWQYAGDKSVDFNYYYKRSLLHGVYLSSQTHYNLDNSGQNIKTREFIDRSLRAVVDTAKCVKKIPNLLKKIPFLRIFI
jgi:ubiquinone biosynthesis protein COQ9